MDEQNFTSEELRLLKIVNLGIEQVVVPAMDRLEVELKGEMTKIRMELSHVKDRVDQIDRKLDSTLSKTIELDHRVQSLET